MSIGDDFNNYSNTCMYILCFRYKKIIVNTGKSRQKMQNIY